MKQALLLLMRWNFRKYLRRCRATLWTLLRKSLQLVLSPPKK